jgi:hypothetical protein
VKKLRVAFLIAALAGAFTAQNVAATHWNSQETVAKTVSQRCVGGVKIDSPVSGTAYNVGFPHINGNTYAGTITFTITDSGAGSLLAFATDHPSHHVTSILVSGGPSNAILYTYSPGVSSDSGLHSPFNSNSGKWYGVSHVCLYLEKKAAA